MAITTKARTKGLLREIRALLADKALPEELHTALEAADAALKKTWADLEADAKKELPADDAPAEDGAQAETQEADISHATVGDLLRKALRAEDPERYAWVSDIYDTWLVYQVDEEGGAYKRSYVIDDQGQVTLGAPQAVIPTMVYLPVAVAGRFFGPAGDKATEALQETGPAQGQPLLGEIVPLIERAVRTDGTVPIKMIAPGWGSSGYYSADLLKRDGPNAFPAGTQMFWDHATPTEEAERPEGSLANLAAVTTSTPTFQEAGVAGPGLYADARVFSGYAQALDELAPYIGVSIRGRGVVKAGEADGRKGLIVEKLLPGRSVDFVTTPGAGGQVLSLFEAARSGVRDQGAGGRNQEANVTEDELKALQEAKGTAEAEVARLREALLLREARDVVAAELGKIEMPDVTRARLVEVLAARPVVKEGKLDGEAFRVRIAEVAQDELTYLAGVTGSGRIVGMGATGGTEATAADVEKRLAEAFLDLGLSESLAQKAAKGR